MSRAQKFFKTDNSGWLFIGFLVVVGIILVFYFVFWSEDVEYDPNEVNKNVNEGINENINAGSSGDSPSLTNSEEPESPDEGDAEALDFTISGYEGITPDIIGDTYLYSLGDEAYLTVMPGNMEGIVRESQNIIAEEDIAINGLDAVRITGASNKDGSPVYLILLEKDEWLYHFGGPEDFLDKVDEIFNFNISINSI